jgi:hypothetical protein
MVLPRSKTIQGWGQLLLVQTLPGSPSLQKDGLLKFELFTAAAWTVATEARIISLVKFNSFSIFQCKYSYKELTAKGIT